MKKILFYGFNIENDLDPYSAEGLYQGDKFKKIVSTTEKAKKDLKVRDNDTDALVVYGEWIERPEGMTDTAWRGIIDERTDFVGEEENFVIIEVE